MNESSESPSGVDVQVPGQHSEHLTVVKDEAPNALGVADRIESLIAEAEIGEPAASPDEPVEPTVSEYDRGFKDGYAKGDEDGYRRGKGW